MTIRKIAKATQKMVAKLEKNYAADSAVLYDAKSELLAAMEEFTTMLEFSEELLQVTPASPEAYEKLKDYCRMTAMLEVTEVIPVKEEEDE